MVLMAAKFALYQNINYKQISNIFYRHDNVYHTAEYGSSYEYIIIHEHKCINVELQLEEI